MSCCHLTLVAILLSAITDVKTGMSTGKAVDSMSAVGTMELCSNQISGQYELISFWVKQDYSSQATKFCFMDAQHVSGSNVMDLPGGDTYYESAHNDYTAFTHPFTVPADGVFMWFGLVLQWDGGEKACKMTNIVHWWNVANSTTSEYSMAGMTQAPLVLDHGNLSASYFETSSQKRAYVKSKVVFDSGQYSAGARLLVHKVTLSSFSRQDPEDPKFLELWMHGRSNYLFKSYSMISWTDSLIGMTLEGVALTPGLLINHRTDDSFHLGLKMINGSVAVHHSLDHCINCGAIVTFNIYGIALLQNPGNSVKLTVIYASGASDNVRLRSEVTAYFTGSNLWLTVTNRLIYNGVSYPSTPALWNIDTGLTTTSHFSNPDSVIVLDIGLSLLISRFEPNPITRPTSLMGYIQVRNQLNTFGSQPNGLYRGFQKTDLTGSNILTANTDYTPTAKIGMFVNSIPDSTDFSVRLYRIETFAGFKDYDSYPGYPPTIDDLKWWSWPCSLPFQHEIRTNSEMAPNPKMCLNFATRELFTSSPAVPNCRAYFEKDNRRCEICNDGYYPDIVDALGSPKEQMCKTQTECETTPGYLFIQDQTNNTVPKIAGIPATFSPFHYQKPVCVTCPLNCKECVFDYASSQINCVTCSDHSITTTPPTLPCTCQISDCLICNATKCDLCKQGFTLNYINDTDRVCSPSTTCDTGYGPNITYIPSLFPTYDNVGGFKVCKQCPANCTDCSTDAAICTTCDTNYKKADLNLAIEDDKMNITGCFLATDTIKGMVYDSGTDQFQACIVNCRVCNETSRLTGCLQCVTDYAVHDTDQTCILASDCDQPNRRTPYTYTLATPPLTSDRCVDYTPNCLFADLNNVCTTCENPYSLQNHLTPKTCILCNRNCHECTNMTNCQACLTPTDKFHSTRNLCLNCGTATNTFWDAPANDCKDCPYNCALCNETTSCIECATGFSLSPDNTACYSVCLSDQVQYIYPNGTQTCLQCPKHCGTCTVDSSMTLTCVSCKSGYNFNPANSCIDCSLPGFSLINGICETCTTNCYKCANDKDICTECNFGWYLHREANFTCGSCSAPDFSAPNKTCVKCLVDNCSQCSEVGTQCATCTSFFELTQNKSCVERNIIAQTVEYDKKLMTISVKFSRNIGKIEEKNVNLTVLDLSSNLGNFSLTLKTIEMKDGKWIFTFTTDKSVQKATLSLHFFDRFAIIASDAPDAYLHPKNQTINISSVLLNWPPPVDSAISSSGAAAVSVVAFLSSAVSFNNAVIMIKIYQMLDFMLLYNVNAPGKFVSFISIFQTMNPTSMLPDLLQTVYDEECSLLGDKFESQDMGCQFFGNCSASLTFFIFHALIAGILRLILLPFKNSNNKFIKILRSLRDGAFGHKGFFNLICMFDIDILIAAATNSKYYAGDKIRTFTNIGNNLVAATVVYFYPLLLVFFAFKTYQVIQAQSGKGTMDQETAKRWEYLVEGRKQNTWFQQYYEPVGLFRNYLVSIGVVGLYDSPYKQLVFCTFLLVASFILTVKHRPFDTRLENISSGLAWFCYSICSLLFIVVHVSNPLMSYDQNNMYLGWPLIIVFSGLVASNMIPPLISSVISIVMAIKNKCCKKKVQNQPENNPEGEGEKKDLDESNQKVKEEDAQLPLDQGHDKRQADEADRILPNEAEVDSEHSMDDSIDVGQPHEEAENGVFFKSPLQKIESRADLSNELKSKSHVKFP